MGIGHGYLLKALNAFVQTLLYPIWAFPPPVEAGARLFIHTSAGIPRGPGYRVQMHNLSRLLRLTLLFTDELKEVFELNTTEGAQLYQLLQNAYSQSRYSSTFDPDGDSVRILSKQVAKFNNFAERVYKQYIQGIKC